jgi:glucose/arabinose dehydrogenase
MIGHRRRSTLSIAALLLALAAINVSGTPDGSALAQNAAQPEAAASGCANDNGGITLSPGFCATAFADNLGHVRHLAVAPNGVVYANIGSGRYYHNDTPPKDGFLLALKNSTGSGHADTIKRFGETAAQGSAGGTGIAFYNGSVYAEVNDRIMRYAIPRDGIVPTGTGQIVLSGLPLTGDHPMHPFIIDATGNLFVDIGSATNSCQAKNRMQCVWQPTLHRAPDPGRDLALRCQQDGTEILSKSSQRYLKFQCIARRCVG